MTDKSAMQTLKEKLLFAIEELGEARPGTEISGYRFALISVVNDIDAQMMEMEREQILDAFVAGDERGTKEIPFNCEQYYNQTYKQ